MKIVGIDLGTTNSLVAYNGQVIGEVVPSIVSFDLRGAGRKFKDDYKTARSFKTDISCGREGKLSTDASTLVLMEIYSIVARDSQFGLVRGEKLNAVISVPAYFNDNQRQATINAAERANICVHGLVNEPTAAAMFYCKNRRGIQVVYDNGGGTFDVSVIDSRTGMFDVQAKNGLKLGGDTFDAAIYSYVKKTGGILSHKLTVDDEQRLKARCEEAKIQLQKTKESVIIFIGDYPDAVGFTTVTLTVEKYKELMKMVFYRTIDLTKRVIAESIMDVDIFDLVLVGGTTHCPYLQEWLEEEIGQKPVDLTYSPDNIVAQGASLYAMLIENGEIELKVSETTKGLGILQEDGTIEYLIEDGSKIPVDGSQYFLNHEASEGISLKLYQGSSIQSKNCEFICSLDYMFSEVKDKFKGKVFVTVDIDRYGIIHLKAKEPLKKEVEVVKNRTGVN